MDERRQQIIQGWQESAKGAIDRLEGFIARLGNYAQADSVSQEAIFDLFRPMNDGGLSRWMDDNPVGGGIDALGAALTGEPLPEPEPMTEEALVEAVFGASLLRPIHEERQSWR